jgi:hypothetical protein
MLDENDQPPSQPIDPFAPDNASGQTADTEALDFDLNCVNCGYNLRGTQPEGTCPECGEPVATTLRPDLLHMAEPGWLDQLRKGSNWVIAAIIMNLAMIPVGMIIGIMAVGSQSMATSGTLPTPALLFIGALGLIVSIAYGVGVWFLTQPEHYAAANNTVRLLARWLILPAMLIGVVGDVLGSLAGTEIAMIVLAGVVDTAASIMLLVGFLSGMLFLRSLAARIPEPTLVSQTTTVFWGYLISMSIAVLFGIGAVIVALTSANSGSSGAAVNAMGAIGLIMCPVALAMIVFIIWWIVLMFRYRTRFTQAYHIARSQPSR